MVQGSLSQEPRTKASCRVIIWVLEKVSLRLGRVTPASGKWGPREVGRLWEMLFSSECLGQWHCAKSDLALAQPRPNSPPPFLSWAHTFHLEYSILPP